MQISDLVPDVYGEIFVYLNPYALNNASLTSKAIRQITLTETLWKKHLESEFPYRLEKGTSFEKYSKCKRNSLSHISGLKERKCVLLIEAGHVNELRTIFPSCHTFVTDFLMEVTLENKTMPRIMNEQNDQAMIDYFYSQVVWKDENRRKYFSIVFGKDYYPDRGQPPNFSIAIRSSSIASLEYFYQQNRVFPIECSHLAAKNGNMKIVQWFFDHGAKFNGEDFTGAAQNGQQDFVRFFLEKMNPSPELIQNAIEKAIINGRPGPLEVLLPYVSQDKADLNHLLEHLNFLKTPNQTAACLKILLEKGADVNHPKMGSRQNETPLFYACCFPNNEMSIEILLNKRATPSESLIPAAFNYPCDIIKMLIDHGAVVTEVVIKNAQLVQSLNKNISEIPKIIELLESHATS